MMHADDRFGLTSPNLRRVKLKPSPVSPEGTVAAQAAASSSLTPGGNPLSSPVGSTPNTPRFARTRQRSSFEFDINDVVVQTGVGTTQTTPQLVRPSVPPTRGPTASEQGDAVGKGEESPPPFAFSSAKSKTKTSADPKQVQHNSDASCSHCMELVKQCVAKDTQISNLTSQLTRLRSCLVAIETCAEKQARHESSSEHDLQKLERKLFLYREALRASGMSPESSDISLGQGGVPSPWGSLERVGDGELGTETLGMETQTRALAKTKSVPKPGDELGIHKVHGGTRFGAGTGTGIRDARHDETDESGMSE